MGIDFRIDNDPTYIVDGNPATRNEAMGIVEDPWNVTEPVTIEVRPVRQVEGPPYADKPRWSYGGFMSFRQELARQIGIDDLRMMEGFFDANPYTLAALRWGPGYNKSEVTRRYDAASKELAEWWRENARRWDDLAPHPLHELLYHSDCDGDLTPTQCASIAPALRDAVRDWPDDFDRQKALALAAMMDVCAAADRRLVFC